MFVEDCGGDFCGARVLHPNCSGAAAVEHGADVVPFAVVLSKYAKILWLVVDEGFHANGNKEFDIVVVRAIYMSVG